MATGNGKVETKQLAHLDFIKLAIETRENPDKGKGLHARFSGFNELFKTYYKLDDVSEVIAIVDTLVGKGKIAKRPCKGGVMLYLPQDAPPERENKAESMLARMLDA